MPAKFIINPPVFFGAIIIIGIFLAVGVVVPDRAATIFAQLQQTILTNFGWFFLLSVGIFLISVLLICLGRHGR
ncbi:BCCT family transporter, partial [Falsochrobactrum ovis]|uniref:BCCT family transporter n=1 Tax=Falsochrobactrum ovis TaxID=1293442 RepID=UPI00360BEDAD